MKKNIFIIGIIVTVLAILAVSVSFAISNTSISTNENQINSGCLKISMDESSGINLVNSFPLTDISGMNTDPYQVSVTNTCSLDATASFYLNIYNGFNLSESSKIKFAVSGDMSSNPEVLSSYELVELNNKDKDIIGTYNLFKASILKDQTKTYDFRMWIDESATSLDSSFHSKLMITLDVMK